MSLGRKIEMVSMAIRINTSVFRVMVNKLRYRIRTVSVGN